MVFISCWYREGQIMPHSRTNEKYSVSLYSVVHISSQSQGGDNHIPRFFRVILKLWLSTRTYRF
jgi:hypothetical protein